jgi:hypothetical protein
VSARARWNQCEFIVGKRGRRCARNGPFLGLCDEHFEAVHHITHNQYSQGYRLRDGELIHIPEGAQLLEEATENLGKLIQQCGSQGIPSQWMARIEAAYAKFLVSLEAARKAAK